jgi:hypothetical protein
MKPESKLSDQKNSMYFREGAMLLPINATDALISQLTSCHHICNLDRKPSSEATCFQSPFANVSILKTSPTDVKPANAQR